MLGFCAYSPGGDAALESAQMPRCPKIRSGGSSCLSMIEVEDTAEPRPADDLAARPILVVRVLD